MNRRRGERRNATPPGGSRLGRRIPTLDELRAVLLADHPECARPQAGGAPRMLPIAQIVCDWATPAGQRVVAEYLEASRTPDLMARYIAKRAIIAGRWERKRLELDERELVARRVAMKDAVALLGAQWEREERAAAPAAKRSAA
jgi:hypothetical protein